MQTRLLERPGRLDVSDGCFRAGVGFHAQVRGEPSGCRWDTDRRAGILARGQPGDRAGPALFAGTRRAGARSGAGHMVRRTGDRRPRAGRSECATGTFPTAAKKLPAGGQEIATCLQNLGYAVQINSWPRNLADRVLSTVPAGRKAPLVRGDRCKQIKLRLVADIHKVARYRTRFVIL